MQLLAWCSMAASASAAGGGGESREGARNGGGGSGMCAHVISSRMAILSSAMASELFFSTA